MSGIAKLFFYMSLIWVIAFGFAESIRFIHINAELRNDMEQMLEQALETGLDHVALRSHVSLIDESICEEEFLKMVKIKYNLKDHDTEFDVYLPKDEDVFFERFKLEPVFADGSYSVQNGEYVQSNGQYPSAILQGIVKVKPFFFDINDYSFDLKFKVDIDNFHVEHTDFDLKEANDFWEN